MSELPNPSNDFRATLDYDLSLTNLNAIFGGMWDALQPYRDVVVQADAAINALNARTLQVIGDSITPELDALRASTAQAQEVVDDLIGNNFAEDLAGKLTAEENLGDLPDKGAARTALELKPVATKDFATQAEAEAGEIDNKPMTPLRTAQAIAALGGSAGRLSIRSSQTVDKSLFSAATFLRVRCLGGGAGGAADNSTQAGQPGEVVESVLLVDELPASIVATVGSGGAGSERTTSSSTAKVFGAGGDTSFGSLLTARGGQADIVSRYDPNRPENGRGGKLFAGSAGGISGTQGGSPNQQLGGGGSAGGSGLDGGDGADYEGGGGGGSASSNTYTPVGDGGDGGVGSGGGSGGRRGGSNGSYILYGKSGDGGDGEIVLEWF